LLVLQGLLTWFGLFIFDVTEPALWGGLSVFASLIPGIGTALVIGPAVASFFTSTLFNAIGLLDLGYSYCWIG
jgi:predicted PurR-regulated permease PerM